MKLTLASALPFALGATALIAGAEVHDSAESKDQVPSFLSTAYSQLKDIHGELSPEVISIWKEVADLYPGDTTDAIQRLTSKGFKPKQAAKRPDSEYDYVITGDELESMFVKHQGSGEKRKKYAGNFKNKKLRVKKPNALGIDEDVKQLSGYLDVDDDKHFFFCEPPLLFGVCLSFANLNQGFSSLEMIQQTTQLHCGSMVALGALP